VASDRAQIVAVHAPSLDQLDSAVFSLHRPDDRPLGGGVAVPAPRPALHKRPFPLALAREFRAMQSPPWRISTSTVSHPRTPGAETTPCNPCLAIAASSVPSPLGTVAQEPPRRPSILGRGKRMAATQSGACPVSAIRPGPANQQRTDRAWSAPAARAPGTPRTAPAVEKRSANPPHPSSRSALVMLGESEGALGHVRRQKPPCTVIRTPRPSEATDGSRAQYERLQKPRTSRPPARSLWPRLSVGRREAARN